MDLEVEKLTIPKDEWVEVWGGNISYYVENASSVYVTWGDTKPESDTAHYWTAIGPVKENYNCTNKAYFKGMNGPATVTFIRGTTS